MHSYLQGHPSLIEAVRRLEAHSPDQFEIFFQRVTATKIESKEQQVETLTRAQDVGMAIRLVKDRKLGFSFTTSLERDAIQRAVDTAMEISAFMPADEFVGLESFGERVYPAVDNHDAKGLAAAMSEKIALAKRLEATCRGADKRITGVRSANFSETIREIHLVDSNGEHIHHQSSTFTAGVMAKSEQDGESQTGHDWDHSNFLEGLDVERVGRDAAKLAVELLGARSAPTMSCPAILRNSVVAELLDFVSSSFSAEEIDKGRSMLADKQGQRVFSELVTLVDDGLLPGGLGTAPFDGEGVPSRRTTLVDGGFVTGALYDGYYARKFGKEPTGSASRSIKGPPSIGFSNLSMQNGRKGHDQLLDGIARGILITDLMGVHTANPVTGDFSLGASGILIEGGKLTRPVRGFAVAGNVLELLRRITDVGSDLRFFGTVGAPSVRVSELSVGGS